MKKETAHLISTIFHPIVFAVLFPFLLIYHQTGDFFSATRWMIFSVAFIIMTGFTFLVVRPDEVLHDFDVSKREKRPVFYGIMIVFSSLYFLAAFILRGIFYPLSIVALGIIVGIGLFDLVNTRVKASVHGGVVAAYMVTMTIFYGYFGLLATLPLPILMAWSRISLKKHTPVEYISGVFLGCIITIGTFVLGKALL